MGLSSVERIPDRVSILRFRHLLEEHQLAPQILAVVNATLADKGLMLKSGTVVDAMLGVYELNRVELLRDVFVWAYERSCQQYVAVQQNLVPPDILRLRYRQALGEVIAAMVRGGAGITEANVLALLPSNVQPEDRAHFTQLVLQELAGLHAGNVVRFGLRPLELAMWKNCIHGEPESH